MTRASLRKPLLGKGLHGSIRKERCGGRRRPANPPIDRSPCVIAPLLPNAKGVRSPVFRRLTSSFTLAITPITRRQLGSARGHRNLEEKTGFGIRQTETGGGNFTPWFNAPSRDRAKIGMFLPVVQRNRRGRASRDVEIHAWRPIRNAAWLQKCDKPLAHGANDGGDGAGEKELRANNAGCRENAPRYEREHRSSGRVSRRRASAGPGSSPIARNGGDVRRMPPAFPAKTSCSCRVKRQMFIFPGIGCICFRVRFTGS